MAKQKDAFEQQLEQWRIDESTFSNEDWDHKQQRLVPGLKKLPEKLRACGLAVFQLDAKGETISRYWSHNDQEKIAKAKADEKWLRRGQADFDKLSASDRKKILALLHPQLADTLEAAWQHLKLMPYHGCFRAPKNSALTLSSRVSWLNDVADALAKFKPEVTTLSWLAAWTHRAYNWEESSIVPLLISAMNAKGKLGDEIYEILRQIVCREHAVGTMASYVIESLLGSDRSEGWGLIEKTLLAAQRQEGLRQIIVESVAKAHPQAFVRLLNVIVDQDLIRFSSVARSVDVWLRLLWDSASTKVLRDNVVDVLKFMKSPADRKKALGGSDPESIYRALWCHAFEDAEAAVAEATRLLKSSKDEIRYVAVWILTQLNTAEASAAKARCITDANLQVAVLAAFDLQGIQASSDVMERFETDDYGDAPKESPVKDYFENLESLYQRLPEKPEVFKAMVWPWTERKVKRSDICEMLLDHLGDRPPTRMLPYMKGVESWHQTSIVERMGQQKKWDNLTRTAMLELAGHASADVRKETYKALENQKLQEAEYQILEGYLSRSATDLRQGIIHLQLKRTDDRVLDCARRLMDAKDASRRMAGLEILRQLCEQNRSRKQAQEIARQFATTQKTTTKEESVQLKEIAESDRSSVSLTDGLGLMNPVGRTKPPQPQKKKVVPVTKTAIECLKSLDDLVHQHRNTSVRYRRWGEWIEELFGAADYGLPEINPTKALAKQHESFPLWETWSKWNQSRPAKLRDKDGLELLRAMTALEYFDRYEWSDLRKFVKKADQKKLAQSVLGEIDPPKLRYMNQLESIIRALFFSEIPKGCVDYLLDCYENTLASIPESMHKSLLDKKTKASNDWNDDDCEDWRRSDVFTVWKDQLGTVLSRSKIKTTEAQVRRRYDLNRFWDQPIEGAARHRVDLDSLLLAYRNKYASYDDVVDGLVGSRDSDRYGEFDDLSALSNSRHRKVIQTFSENKGLEELVEKIRERVLEVELLRGEKATVCSKIATSIHFSGSPTLFRILAALNGSFKVLGRYGSNAEDSKQATLTEMVKSTYPLDSETEAEFAKLVKQAKADGYVTDDLLLELAFLAPQWSKFVGSLLGWNGFSEGLYWFLAHMNSDGTDSAAQAEGLVDDDDSDDDDLDDDDDDDSSVANTSDNDEDEPKLSAWERLILERTPLKATERYEGAVDVDWFHRTFQLLGDVRWKKMAQSAKLASNSSQAKKAQFLTDVLLGITPRKDLVDGIKKRNLKEYVRLLGLLPLATGQKREQDLLERYQVLVDYKKYARKLSSLTKPAAMRALEIGLSNLARLAGYSDPLRLEWALEAASLKDLAKGPVSVTKEGVTVTLLLDQDAKPELQIRKGDKPLKAVPAPLRKKHAAIAELVERAADLRKKTGRMKQSLEAAMCRADEITADELLQLMQHPILAPQMKRVVLIGDGIAGYPEKDGKVLRDHRDKLEPVKKSEKLRIAHSADLFKRGDWDKWQHECFQSERVQPFKQVFRELYLTTKSEKAATSSSRFSGHQIGPKQAMALWNGRGWHTQEGVMKVFHELSLIASVSFQNDVGTAAEIEGLTMESVEFRKRDSYKSLKLTEIPPIVFSEVMRDVDLVVSVAHRGEVDPEASESTVQMRATLIRETCQLLGLKNVKFKATHVVIDGYYGEYSLHLGSGGVHKLPGGALAILPVHAQHRGRLFLPFADNDPKTAEIVSKVLLLAKDDEIMDPTILDQLGAPVRKRPQAVVEAAAKAAKDRAAAEDAAKATTKGAKGKPSGKSSSNTSTSGKRRFEFSDGGSNKFWQIERSDRDVTTTWGRIGTDGQSKTKQFATEAKAQEEYDKLVREKTTKGYVEKGD
ncbi:MAG: DUF5724 domain-containing protein [Pirellulaceae bacterium]|nr:DUF5724 domain-containing protein [Pirellulaceae bacterium]